MDPQKELIGDLVLAERRGTDGVSLFRLIVVHETNPEKAKEAARRAFPDYDIASWVCEAPRDVVERHNLQPGEAQGFKYA